MSRSSSPFRRTGLNDTSPEAQAVLDDVFRHMPVERKWELLRQEQRRLRMFAAKAMPAAVRPPRKRPRHRQSLAVRPTTLCRSIGPVRNALARRVRPIVPSMFGVTTRLVPGNRCRTMAIPSRTMESRDAPDAASHSRGGPRAYGRRRRGPRSSCPRFRPRKSLETSGSRTPRPLMCERRSTGSRCP